MRAVRPRAWIAAVSLLAVLLFGHAASAQPANGFYLGGAVGYGLLQDQATTVTPAAATRGKASFAGGVAAVAAVGYGFGNGLRLEVEGDFRSNGQRRGGGSEAKYGGMGNLLFDLDLGVGWITPYIGGGVGYQAVDWRGIALPGLHVNQSVGGLAYQAILGAGFPVDAVPGLSFTLEYRYLAVAGTRHYAGAPASVRVRVNGDDSHALLVGVRYAFDTPPGVDERPPLAQSVPPAMSTRTYLVYFDDQSSKLTARAKDVLAEAIRASTRVTHTRIEIAGDATPGGSVSLQRARNVAAEMERAGVPASAIDIRSDVETKRGGVAAGQRVEVVYR